MTCFFFLQVELTDVQKKYYRAILERNFSFLSLGATQNSNVPNLLNTMMELRKCCNHPYLITGTPKASRLAVDAEARCGFSLPHPFVRSRGRGEDRGRTEGGLRSLGP